MQTTSMIISRKLFEEIENFIESKQAIVVNGMRRVGKTTLLTYFFKKIKSKNKILLDLEDPLNQAIFETNSFEEIKNNLEIRGIDFSLPSYIFLDEIQSLKKIPSIVKYFYDHYKVKFFLTGSASFYLKNLFSESLAGRKYLFDLYPLDFEEFLIFKKINFLLPSFSQLVNLQTYQLFLPLVKEYLTWGGMPEIALIKNPQEKEKSLRDIFSSYFQKEILTLSDFRKNQVIKNLILLLSRRTSQKIDIKKLSSELSVSRETIYQYLEFLNQTYFITLLPALGNIDVAIRKQKKVYLVDSGFFSVLEKPTIGQIFENAVFNQLKHIKGDLFYYSDKNVEIDFILKLENGEKIGFEVKETATLSDIKKLERISQKIGLKKSYLISLNYFSHKRIKYLFQIPKFLSGEI